VVADTYVTSDAGTGIVHQVRYLSGCYYIVCCLLAFHHSSLVTCFDWRLQAPAFGEDDWRVCIANAIIDKMGSDLPNPVDETGMPCPRITVNLPCLLAGCFTADVTDFQGQYIKKADDNIKARLKADGTWFGPHYYTCS
jgi:isoleucyl-tRNA synthetase